MTREPCDKWCPLGACAGCQYRGGTFAAEGDSRAGEDGRGDVSWAAAGIIEAAPGGASTPFLQGPRPPIAPEDYPE